DLSRTYLDWARRNHELNGQNVDRFDLVQADARRFLAELPSERRFDLAVVDPPTFSNSKRTDDDWDVQLHHAELLMLLAARMSPGGVIYFSTNFRRFKLEETSLVGLEIEQITSRTVPEDFANKRTHACWRMVVRA
ncbi:MAG: class I SAM-dependent methyltransferase, partial [Phycisphaerae bacterium]|nr:class I SAM-dependent methyltransferase [Phycisphaerae bacterium]